MNKDCIFRKQHDKWEECTSKGLIQVENCVDNVCTNCKMYFKDMVSYTKSLRSDNFKLQTKKGCKIK